MMGESCVCLGSKKSKFLVRLDYFSKYLKYWRNFENPSNKLKTQISLLPRHAQLSLIILSQVRSLELTFFLCMCFTHSSLKLECIF